MLPFRQYRKFGYKQTGSIGDSGSDYGSPAHGGTDRSGTDHGRTDSRTGRNGNKTGRSVCDTGDHKSTGDRGSQADIRPVSRCYFTGSRQYIRSGDTDSSGRITK